MMIGFNTVAVGTPDDPVLDVLQDVLADGKTSRLYRKLVEDERIASGVDAGNNAGRYPGWFAVNVELLKGKDRKKAEETGLRGAGEARGGAGHGRGTGPRAAEDPRVVRVRPRERPQPRRRDRPHQHVPRRRGRGEVLPGLPRPRARGDEGGRPARREAVPRAQDRPRGVERAEGGEEARRARRADVGRRPRGRTTARADRFTARLAPRRRMPRGRRHFSLTAAKRVVLPNGLTLILLEDHRLPVVVAAAEVARRDAPRAGGQGRRRRADRQPARRGHRQAHRQGDRRAHRGHRRQPRRRRPAAVAQGAYARTPTSAWGCCSSASCSRPSRPTRSSGCKDQQLSAIADAETQPRHAGQPTRSTRLVYGEHPFGRPWPRQEGDGREADRRRLQGVPHSWRSPRTSPPSWSSATSRPTRWRRRSRRSRRTGRSPTPAKPAVPGAAEARRGDREDRQRPERGAGPRLHRPPRASPANNPDYYKLLVMDNVLGTGPGFTDRLSATLRDRQGLAYTVNATIAELGRQGAGHVHRLHRHVPRQVPRRAARLPEGVNRDPRRAADQGRRSTTPRSTCSAACRSGSRPLSAVAGQLLAAERYGLGFDFLEKYRRKSRP